MDEIKKQAKKIKEVLSKILKYLRINDEKGLLSLTNIAMILVLYKLAMTPATTFEDLATLGIAVLGYQSKRLIEGKKS
jgi:hypothetical protein